jgi:hypothetical protein
MPSGRVPIRPKVGYSYQLDCSKIVTVIRQTANEDFPILSKDEEGNFYKHTLKGRATLEFGNHPNHMRKELRKEYKEVFNGLNGR